MKKFFSIFALTMMFLTVSTVANAQWNDNSHFGGHSSSISNDNADYNRCRDEVRKGDYNYTYGCYEAAISHYDKARHYNNCCSVNHRYTSNHELDNKIDDCRRAMHRNDRPAVHHTERHHSSSNDAAVGAAVGGGLLLAAIIGAAVSSDKESKAKKAEPSNASYNTSYATSYTNNQQLSHFNNGNLAYDATCSDLQIKSIERTPEGTVVNFEFLNLNKADNINMARSIYLKDRSTNQRFRSLAIHGLDYERRTHVDQGESYEFSVTFPEISASCHEVDIVESPSSPWKFYHVNF